tara:strand:- start:10434 stop:11720 length:1287 start_codon:yes stop_codon:yes gene_type:complete
MKTFGLDFYLACGLVAACFILGGSASRPDFEMGLSILAMFCLVASIWVGEGRGLRDFSVGWVIGPIIALYILELLPLPSGFSSALGQLSGSYPQAIFSWRPVTLSPDATLYSLLSLAPALVLMWLTAGLNRDERALLINTVLVLAVFEASVGIAQAVGVIPFNLYEFYHPRVAVGLFASRNHFGDLFLLVTPLLFANKARWIERFGLYRAQTLLYSLLLLYFAAVVASASRASIVLFLIIAFGSYVVALRSRLQWRFFVVGVLAALVGWLLLAWLPATGVVKVATDRFQVADEARWEIWHNSRRTAIAFWPSGAGFGNFRTAYEAIEPVSAITPSYINAAHNEYLQLLVESGLFGFVTSIFIVVFVLAAALRRRRDALVTFAFFGLIGTLAHSAVDYPFRVVGLNALIGFLCALCVTVPPENVTRRRR